MNGAAGQETQRPQSRGRRWISIGVFTAAAIVAALLFFFRVQTYHFAQVEKDVLYRDGNRGLREFGNALRRGNVKTVVMLNDDDELKKEPFARELEFCRERGIEVVRIPVKLGGYPNTENVREFLRVMADRNKWPVMVHCAQGVRRTGMMVAAYQESVMGYDDAKAKAMVVPWGRKPTSQTLADIKAFIEGYDGKKKAVVSAPPLAGDE